MQMIATTAILLAIATIAFGDTPTTQPTLRPATQPASSSWADRFIFPGAATQGKPIAQWRTGPTDLLLKLKASDGVRIAAVFGKGVHRPRAASDAPPPTLLYFYGNGMCMADARPVFNQFRRLGYDVIMPDYEEYGLSAGHPSETGCYAAADAVYDYLLTRKDVDPRRIVACGWSLGAAVATDLAVRRPVAGLIVFSSFTNIQDMITNNGLWIPAGFLTSARFDNLAKFPAITCPILMFHGNLDTLAPPEMSDRLAAVAKTKVKLVHIPQAAHNDLMTTASGSLYPTVQAFLDHLPPAPVTQPANQ